MGSRPTQHSLQRSTRRLHSAEPHSGYAAPDAGWTGTSLNALLNRRLAERGWTSLPASAVHSIAGLLRVQLHDARALVTETPNQRSAREKAEATARAAARTRTLTEAAAARAAATRTGDAAAAQVAALTDEVAELRAQAQQADQAHQAHQAERDRLAREMREVEARAVRAESTADAMRETLDGLRADLRQAMNRTTQQAKK